MRNILSNDVEMPVRIEAATALQQLLSEQEKGLFAFPPHIFWYTLWCVKTLLVVSYFLIAEFGCLV